MEKKKTALNQLESEIVGLEKSIGVHNKFYELIEKFKKVEREQIKEAYVAGRKEDYLDSYYDKHGYEYYDETYVSTKNLEMTKEEKIIEFIEDMKKSWIPKTRTGGGYGYHGSNKGDYMEYTEYFNTYEADWTTDKDYAFKGYVFQHISDILFDMYLKRKK